MEPARRKNGEKNGKKKHKVNLWPMKAFFITLSTALLLSLFSETVLLGVSLPVALLVLALIIVIGIAFDIIGIAVTFQDVTAYTAMASKRIAGAKQAIKLVQNAHLVSNICNDVVGDICGIISGAMGAAISIRLITTSANRHEFWLNIVISSLIAALTVCGKAFGKTFAVQQSHKIVFLVGKLLSFVWHKGGIKGK
ncbi:MAG: hypothetical protein AAGU74_03565 [Bacillota bacterium]